MPQPDPLTRLRAIHENLRACRKCPSVCDRAVHGPALATKVMLVGQAPGIHEGTLGRPFAHTAGKTLFKWLAEATGADEATIRGAVYISAVARCFPGKAASGKGDRPPSAEEIRNCSEHLKGEIEALRPSLILAVGKSAILETLAAAGIGRGVSLAEVVGRKIRSRFHGVDVDIIPLPHPSGVSRWPHTAEGKEKLAQAFALLRTELTPLL